MEMRDDIEESNRKKGFFPLNGSQVLNFSE
jgi:hypothetical protein